MKVNKDKFDALLGKLTQAPLAPVSTIEPEGKTREIIPSPSRQLRVREAIIISFEVLNYVY